MNIQPGKNGKSKTKMIPTKDSKVKKDTKKDPTKGKVVPIKEEDDIPEYKTNINESIITLEHSDSKVSNESEELDNEEDN